MTVSLALDAMGGDYLAIPNLQGALSYVEQYPDVKVLLCGPEAKLLAAADDAEADTKISPYHTFKKSKFLEALKAGQLQIVEYPEWVDMDESPSIALRQKRNSSLAGSFQLVKEGKAQAAISAGNSGAVMAFGIAKLGRIAGVRRPAILCNFPSPKGLTAVLDCGANVDCTAEQIAQFGIMGAIYYKSVFEEPNCKVALMNIGEEEGKGCDAVKLAHVMLKEKIPHNYIGFVEGRDLMTGKVDVIACDGFVGNVILKTCEGVASTIKNLLKEELTQNPLRALGAWLAKGGFTAMKAKMDYREYGAAPLIGLDGLGLVAHGSSDSKAIQSALKLAERFVKQDLMGQLRQGFQEADQV